MYNASQLHRLYDIHASQAKNNCSEIAPNFESDKCFKGGNYKDQQFDQPNHSSSLLVPNLWEEAFGLDDLEFPEFGGDSFLGESNQGSLNELDSNMDLLDAPNNKADWNDFESISQDSSKTVPLVCNKTVLNVVDINAIQEKEENLKFTLVERDRSHHHSSRRVGRKSIPDEMKDDRYWKRRLKNNLAAKRSRDAKRMKECEIEVKATCLETINENLRMQVSRLSAENSELRCRLAKYEGPQVLQESSGGFTKTGNKHMMKSHGDDSAKRNKRNSSTPSYLKGFDLS